MNSDTSDWKQAPSIDDLRRSYDQIPYPNLPKPFTHISRVGAIGRLRGVAAAVPTRCRVLELGCADGGNLLPMAVHFPESEFVGIDLSLNQIATGRQVIEILSLRNIGLLAANILEIRAEEIGRFDYILVHGVYSWVPPAVQERILSICQEQLTSSGLAYVSYNTFPGWRGKQALQEMLRYHTRSITDFQQKIAAAREFLEMLPRAATLPNDPAALLADRLRRDLERSPDSATYLLHEYLVDVNEPLYFHEFISRIEAHGLQYVDDAYPGSTALDRLPTDAREWVAEHMPDFLEQQQYIDFAGNVAFRRSLLCRDHWALKRQLSFEQLRGLYVNATCRREESPDGSVHFRTDAGRRFTLDHDGMRGMLEQLLEAHPRSLSVVELREALGTDIPDEAVTEMFESLLISTAVEFGLHPIRCALTIAERPRVSPLVRHDAVTGLVTTALHRSIRLENSFEICLLQLLDGTRTVPELTRLLQQRLKPNEPISDARWQELVLENLAKIAGHGWLE